MTDSQTTIQLFADRLAAVGGTAHHVATLNDAIALIVPLATGGTAWASANLIEHFPELEPALADANVSVRVPASAAEVRDQALGIAIAEGAIAETGSAIMSEPAVPSRAVTLVTETLVILCPTARLLPSLDEAAGALRAISQDGASYATFISGPSRTADIERQLTVGVQGPGVLHMILVDNLA